MNSERAGYPRGDANESNTKKSDSRLKQELDEIFKKGELNAAVLEELKRKFKNDDEFLDTLLEMYNERSAKINKNAVKMAEYIKKKGLQDRLSNDKLLKGMLKIKVKKGFTDAEFDRFKRLIQREISYNTEYQPVYDMTSVNRSKLNRVLGIQQQFVQGMDVSDSEIPIVKEIIDLCEKNNSLHRDIMKNALLYRDCAIEAISGQFDRTKHYNANYIDPVFAALFLPRIGTIDFHFIFSNIGRMVQNRYNKKQVTEAADSELLGHISIDPNDLVCEGKSPVDDLRNRYHVQINLWKIVLKLRNGLYYDAEKENAAMDKALMTCRSSFFESTDNNTLRDEATFMKKLFSAFSFRPTYVTYTSAQPMQEIYGDLNIAPGYVTSTTMLTIHLPTVKSETTPSIHITNALNQLQTISTSKNSYVPTQQRVVFSRGVIIFNVKRRILSTSISGYVQPVPFNILPFAQNISSINKVSDFPVSFTDSIDIAGERFILRSVVCVETLKITKTDSKIKNTVIPTNTSALLCQKYGFDGSIKISSTACFQYDPFKAAYAFRHPNPQNNDEQTSWFANKPVSEIDYLSYNQDEAGLYDKASTTGTIFIYSKATEDDDSICL